MRPAAQHAEDTGKAFIAAVKAARKDYETACHHYYEHFIAGHEKPTPKDAHDYAALVAEMEVLANFLHVDVRTASQGFGGPQDHTISTQHTGVDTVKKKAA